MAMVQLLVDGGIGLILIISGIFMNMISNKHNKQCTKSVEGKVISYSYSFPGESRMYPIVEYVVDGITYKTKKKYKGIKSIKASGIPLPVKSKAYEDEKGYLHIKSGAIVNVRQMAEKLWPINSKMIVYYNPDNPKICFVDRPIYNSFASKMFIIMGSVVIVISIIVFVLMQL